MRYILYLALFIFSFLITNNRLSEVEYSPEVIQVQAPTTPKLSPKLPVVKRKPTEAQIALINQKALQYGVSTTTLTKVISCESSFVETAMGDGGYSRGLVQIHAKYHPDVTYAQATDPEFAIDFLARNLSEGRGSMWTCYRNLTIK